MARHPDTAVGQRSRWRLLAQPGLCSVLGGVVVWSGAAAASASENNGETEPVPVPPVQALNEALAAPVDTVGSLLVAVDGETTDLVSSVLDTAPGSAVVAVIDVPPVVGELTKQLAAPLAVAAQQVGVPLVGVAATALAPTAATLVAPVAQLVAQPPVSPLGGRPSQRTAGPGVISAGLEPEHTMDPGSVVSEAAEASASPSPGAEMPVIARRESPKPRARRCSSRARHHSPWGLASPGGPGPTREAMNRNSSDRSPGLLQTGA